MDNLAENSPHISVLLNEAIEGLKLKAGEFYVDATFGAGGYSKAILESSDANVIAIDQDPYVLEFAQNLKEQYPTRFNFLRGNFAEIDTLIENKVSGIVYDLGVSSMQFDQKDRGFSFQKNAKLDMRMSQEGISAFEIINETEEEELANIIYEYGQEKNSRKIAKNIIKFREEKPIETTLELANIIRSCTYKTGKIDPATKTFQAIRIAVNDELGSLKQSLASCLKILKSEAKIAIVSFHELEDRIVKDFFIENSDKKIACSKYSTKKIEYTKPLKIITKKAITPSRAEIVNNVRARSAKLRIAEMR